MITLNELISLVNFSLNGKASAEKIEEVLIQSDIAELLELSVKPTSAKQLIIREVLVRGQKWVEEKGSVPFEYRRGLQTGINAWISGNSSGKSTILKSILWAITGTKPNFKSDVYGWIENVFVEFELTKAGIFTIQYAPNRTLEVSGSIQKSTIQDILEGRPEEVVHNFSGFRAMKQVINDFFGTKVGFLSLEWLDRSSDTVNLTKKTISWETYSQALYINSDNTLDYLFPENQLYGKHHQKAISIYLGLGSIEATARAQYKYDETNNLYAFEKRRIEANSRGVAQEIAICKKELGEIESKINQIEQEQTVLIDPMYAFQVHEKVAEVNDRLFVLTEERDAFMREHRKAKLQYDDYRRAAQGLREAISFNLILSGIKVSKCPHCENLIPQVDLAEEFTSGHCHVCNGELKSLSGNDYIELLRKTDESVEKLRKDLKGIGKEIARLDKLVAQTRTELEAHNKEYCNLSRQERSGIKTELQNLINRQGFLNGQLVLLTQLTKENQQEKLLDLGIQRDIFREVSKVLRQRVASENEMILNHLSVMTTQLAKKFGVQNLEKVFIDDRYELMIEQSNKTNWYPKMDTGERLRIKLAFHLSLLNLRIKENIGRHPCIIILDAPGSAEITDNFFEVIIEGFSDIANEFGDNVQILVASARQELANILDSDKVQVIPNRETLF